MASHKLTNADDWFFRLNKTDTLTGEQFKVGDEIYVCRQCKACYKSSSWVELPEHKCVAHGCGANSWISHSEFNKSFFTYKFGEKQNPDPPLPPRPLPPQPTYVPPTIVHPSNSRQSAVKIFAILIPILALLIGQIVQYVVYFKNGSVLLFDVIFNSVPLWILIVSSVLVAIEVILVIVKTWHMADDSSEFEAYVYFIIASILFGVIPCVISFFGIIAVPLINHWIEEYDEEYIGYVVVAVPFVIGQVAMWVPYSRTGEILVLSNLVNASGNTTFNILAFSIISSILLAIASIIIAIRAGMFELPGALCAFVPFAIFSSVLPALMGIPLIVYAIILTIVAHCATDEDRAGLITSIVSFSLIVILSIILGIIAAVSLDGRKDIESNGVKYLKGDDGKYYVVDYSGDDDVIKIPNVVNNKFEVGGVSEEFIENTSCYVLNLDYEFGTDNIETLKVIAFTLKTEETLPIPQREGYTFYGWWSTNNRNTGKQITNEEGKITTSSIDKKQDIHAMWFGADYTFISSYKDFNIYNSSKYVLVNDIEMPSNFTPVGGLSGMEIQSSRSSFNGVLDGNYHIIKYAITGSRRYNGLFSWIGSRGVVRNLGVNVNINVSFKPTSTQYYAFAGGVAAINDGTIYNCWSTGKIYIESATSVAFSGGIAGASGTNNAQTGEIKNCYNLADLETVADDAYAGGILGSAENNAHIVSYCYNRGTIKATGVNSNNTVAGGIISHGRTYAKNCFNAGAILTDYSNKQTLGGIIGFTRDTSSHNNFPTNCVWLKHSNCQARWGVGQYPNDSSGGNNKGVTVVTEENAKAVRELNGDTNYFILNDGKIHLAWERHK